MNSIVIGKWSDQGEGRRVSHSWKKEARNMKAKAKSKTEGLGWQAN